MAQITEPSNVYLKTARIKDFRTIKNAKLDFSPNLNIIIGKNGAGKTNLATAISNHLDIDEDEKININADYIFSGKETFTYSIKKSKIDKYDIHNPFKFIRKTHPSAKLSIDEKSNEFVDAVDALLSLTKRNLVFSLIHIKHDINYEKLLLLNIPASFAITQDLITEDIFEIINSSSHPYFTKSIFRSLALRLAADKEYIDADKEYFNHALDCTFNASISTLNNHLKKYTNIQEVRLGKNINIYFDKTNNKYTLTNILYEFKINNDWMPFSNLSDGTKRVFCLIANLLIPYSYVEGINKDDELLIFNRKKIMIIEEPELGIHPKQLFSIMNLVKNISNTHQIIVITHAPTVLDYLDKDELNKLIICSYEDESGTQFKHLSKAKMKQALSFMEDMNLSDYWRSSDLEANNNG